MEKQYRPWDLRQELLLPPSLLEWLPQGHLAYFVVDTVAELDLREIEDVYQGKDRRGQRPYDPRMLTALILYSYCTGVCSSRRIERATYENVAFRVLSGDTHPDHSRISEFRRVHLPALERLFVQVLRLCQQAGLVSLGHVALDGTKMKADASKHKAMSYERMLRSETELRAEVKSLLAQAEGADAEEDEKFGAAKRGDELPEELADPGTRIRRIREAKARVAAQDAPGSSEATDSDSASVSGGGDEPPAVEGQTESTGGPQAQTRAAECPLVEPGVAAPEDLAGEIERREKKIVRIQAARRALEAEALVAHARELDDRASALEGQARRADEPRRTQLEERGVSAAAEADEIRIAAQARLEEAGIEHPAQRYGEEQGLPFHEVQTDPRGNPAPKAQRNFTDPDSRIMKGSGGFVQAYNCQIAVDHAAQVIVGTVVTNSPVDVDHLRPLIDSIETTTGALPATITADAGYWATYNDDYCQELEIDDYIAVGRTRHADRPACDPGPMRNGSSEMATMRQKTQSATGKAIYRRRKAIVEPVFGQIKGARGIRGFLLRGIYKVRGEWSLIALTHNLLKLYRLAAT